jgi:hypothetical protein
MRRGGPTLHKIYPAATALVILAALPMFAPRAAQAQTVSSPLPIRVKLGILTPQEGKTRDTYGSPLYFGEIEVALPSLTGGRYSASVGYGQNSRDGNTFRVIPITVSRLFSPPNPVSGATGNIYYGLGAGAYLMRASGNGSSVSKTNIGGFGVAGYQAPGGSYFFEAKYHLVGGSVRGAKASGLALMLGRRF